VPPVQEIVEGWDKRIDYNGYSESVLDIAMDGSDNIYVVGYGTNLVSSESNRIGDPQILS